MDIRSKLIELRNSKGYTQQDVADKLDIGRVSYARYENGQRIPHTKLISKLAEIYEVSTDYLLNDNKENNLDNNEIKFGSLTKHERKMLKLYREISASADPADAKYKKTIDAILSLGEREDGE